jgi:hypothetical protein
MKTKREEKLEQQLSACRQALRRERQKNRDISQSRDGYKVKNRGLSDQLKKAEAVVKKKSSRWLTLRAGHRQAQVYGFYRIVERRAVLSL